MELSKSRTSRQEKDECEQIAEEMRKTGNNIYQDVRG
jgi:hypothetical protein